MILFSEPWVLIRSCSNYVLLLLPECFGINLTINLKWPHLLSSATTRTEFSSRRLLSCATPLLGFLQFV